MPTAIQFCRLDVDIALLLVVTWLSAAKEKVQKSFVSDIFKFCNPGIFQYNTSHVEKQGLAGSHDLGHHVYELMGTDLHSLEIVVSTFK